ncbi:hypothetical protein V9T40_006085 [Parthenolecanium corni]|uniref:type I protein arginine methyltransferase n=1 Tax=Parthenolecanium corni TaxID=536013 RepID=A0AAN9TTA2_9HEMI
MDFHSMDMTEDESDVDDESWEEMDEADQEVDCLFCSSIFSSLIQALSHCVECHKIDFRNLQTKFNMDCYSFIKLVNFIRDTSALPENLISAKSALWNNEKYLKPVKDFDPWLMFDFEDYYAQSEVKSSPKKISNGHLVEQDLISELQAQLAQKEEEISALKNQIALMKNCVHNMLEDDSSGESRKPNHSVDASYFDSYCNPGIHHEMLNDTVRTLAYKDAILNNESIFAEKTVLDLGCGTGMLSMFAASVPSQKVFAIDNSDIAYYAVEIIKENNLDSKIDIVKGRIEDDRSEFEKVDIIVSEWMGYFLLFEGMLDSLIHARENYLKPNGVLLPDSCSLFLCGAHDPEGFADKIGFWSDVFGYRMSAIQREVIKEAIIDAIPSEKIVTSEACISSFNLYTCSVADTNFSSSVELTYNEDTTITTLVGYFDTTFNLPNRVHFSTGPFSTLTHWKQTLFYLPERISRKKGEKLTVNISCKRCTTDKRALIVTFAMENREYTYNVR